MSLITWVWSVFAAAVVTLAAVHGLAWLLNRRNVSHGIFFCIAVAVACLARLDVAMMHSSTPAEYGEWVRWYQVPSFVFFVGCLLFVRTYLGTGRLWLAWAIVAVRFVVLVVNFLVSPNFTFRAISSLQQVPVFGERVSVVGAATVRSWQWLPALAVVAVIAFIIDAAIQCWRKGGRESHRKALVVACGMALPLSITLIVTLLAVLQVAHIPLATTPFFLITVAAMTFELSRAAAASTRMQQEVAQLRADVARAERVTALGQLASALAHELSQPLAAILRNAEAAHLYLNSGRPDLEELRSIVNDIHKDDRRAGELIDRMRALFKRGNLDMQPLAIGELLQDVLSLVNSEALSRRVSLDFVVEPGLPLVRADRVHVSQVLLNLILNAMEAMQPCAENARRVHIVVRAAGECVEVGVSDSGPGIAEGNIDRVFDPLFSTKHEGLGMGLAISRTIIEAHGGRLWADNNASGATFRFTLPIVHQTAPLIIPSTESVTAYRI
jgi:signal transduction histidine kinase